MPGAKPSARKAAGKQVRLSPDRRRRMIVEEATRYFAEGGKGSGTSGLARRIGVTQPLLYRYFRSKNQLLDAVYKNAFTFERLWEDRWRGLLADRSVPLRERLVTFYRDYFRRVLTREYCRLSMHAALSNYQHGMGYVPLRKHILPAMARELIASGGSARRMRDIDLEVVSTLHAAIYHLAVLRWVYEPPLKGDMDRLIALKVDVFLDGATQTLAKAPRAVGGRGRKTPAAPVGRTGQSLVA